MGRKVPIFYNALMLTGVNLLLRMVGTSFQVYLSGQIGAAGIGLLQLVLSIGSMALTAGMAGIRTATMYLTAEELGKGRPRNVAWVLSGAFLYSLLCSGTVALILWGFSQKIAGAWIGDIRTAEAIRLLAAFLPITCLSGVMTGYFTAANRIGTLAAVEVVEQGFSILCTIAALQLWAKSDPARACQAVVLGSGMGAILTLLCLALLRCRNYGNHAPPIPIARRLTAAAVPLAVADDLKAGISTIENLMVPKRLALYHGASDPLALFGTVCGMVFPILMFPAAILFGLTELLIPEMARCNAAGSHGRIHYLMRRSLRIALLYGAVCGGVLMLAAPELCLRLYGSAKAGAYLRWFAPLTVMLYCDIVTDAMIKGLGQQKASVRYNIITSAMDVIFLFYLLPRYGIAGYFASFLVTHAVNFFLSLRRLIIITKQPISVGNGARVILVASVSIAISQWIPATGIRIISYLLILFSGLICLGSIGKQDLRWMEGLLKK